MNAEISVFRHLPIVAARFPAFIRSCDQSFPALNPPPTAAHLILNPQTQTQRTHQRQYTPTPRAHSVFFLHSKSLQNTTASTTIRHHHHGHHFFDPRVLARRSCQTKPRRTSAHTHRNEQQSDVDSARRLQNDDDSTRLSRFTLCPYRPTATRGKAASRAVAI